MAQPSENTPSGPPVASAGTDATDEPASQREPDPPGVGDGRIARLAFYFVWVFAVPFALAIGSVWLLTPAPGAINPSGLRVFVAEQQIPMGIVLFTLFAMLLWRFRHDLPLAAAIGVGGRKDIPANTRARYEDAGALLDEAHRILRARRRDVERELTAAERDQLNAALANLDRTMNVPKFDAGEFDVAHARADRAVGEHLARWRKGEMREYMESIGIAVAVALILRAFVVEAFKIPSGSMIPTLMIGDHIFVNKFTYGPLVPWTDKRLFSRLPPQRGDVMVFKFPENKEQDFIKRTIATPGDVLEAIDGRPMINGWLVPHCYVGPFKYENRSAELFVEYLEDKSYFTLFDSNPDEQACTSVEDCGAGLACRGGICGILQGPFHVAPGEAWVMGDNRNNSHDSRSWRGGLGAGVPFENIKGRAMFVWMSFGPGGSIAQDRLFVNVLGRPKLPAGAANLQSAVDKCLATRPPLSETTPPPPGTPTGYKEPSTTVHHGRR
ncbi:MAG: signal peptidase I [Byssovorax sp.]